MLSASPGTINVGSTSTLSWTTTGNPTTATIDNGIGSVIPAGGSMTVSPVVSTTYTMTVTNVTDSATCSTLVTVNPLPIPTFTATGNLNVARAAHTATLLNDGRVLIVGGFTGNTDQSTASAEMYDPFTGMFTPTGSLNIARWGHSAVLLNDGRVLVVGGNKTCCQNYPVETELYDPISGAFSLGPSLPNALGGSALSVVPLVKMPDGTVLIVNGNRQITGATTDVLRYDPASNGVTLVGSTLVAHSGPQSGVALLNSGKILVTLEVFSELYDPVTNTSRATAGQMSEVRQRPAGVLLRDGRYVMAAGNRPDGSATGSLVIFDPSTEFYFDTGDRTIQGEGTVGTLLTDGRALFSGSTLMPGAAIFDPATNALTPIQPIDVHRQWHTATVLKDGRVLLAGGHPDVPVNSAELFVP